MEHFWWWIRFYALRLAILAAVIALSWSVIKNGIKPLPSPAITPEVEIAKSQLDVYGSMSKNLSAEQKKALEDIGLGKGAVTVEVYRPATTIQKQLSHGHKSFDNFLSKLNSVRNYIISKKGAAITFLKLFLTLSFLALAALRILKLWHTLRIVSTMLIKISKALIIPVSLIALIVAFGFRVNIWQTADFAFFWVPIGMLLLGSLGLWMVDDNYPIWKTIYTELMFPIASGVGIIVKSIFF